MQPGQPAPSFRLTAAVSGRVIGPGLVGERPLVLLFHNQHTLAAVRELQEAVRQRYPSAQEVLVASVADTSKAPRLLRGVVEAALKHAYAEASKFVPAGLDPADYVIILPDWSGAVTKAYGVGNVDREGEVVVIDGMGRLVGKHRGQQPGQAALAFLASLKLTLN
ncbi:MAG: hypothetical protein K1X65_06190 [Caldilineales bacterium]|nr:hypothetical protein [Caldilineales bacterium]MCW5861117.1 hypothetical protein [Caldilineales bacterium]